VAGAKKRSGGHRGGAGRPGRANGPRKPVQTSAQAPRIEAPRIDWRAVTDNADAGATEQEIVRGLGISDEALADPIVLARFRAEINAGHARYQLELRKSIRRRGLKTTKAAGSVNALALQARNILDWDKQLPSQETEPDLGTARQRLRDLFVKLAESRSDIEGRKVTALELLHRLAQGDRPGGKES
jgi:hypothetical protein